MTVLADVDFYIQKYLLGKTAPIPLPEFSYWARKASLYVSRATFGRVTFENAGDEVKLCVCALAEAYYAANEARQPDNVKSESVGGHSVTYADQKTDSRQLDEELHGITATWLGNTGLLYRGV